MNTWNKLTMEASSDSQRKDKSFILLSFRIDSLSSVLLLYIIVATQNMSHS